MSAEATRKRFRLGTHRIRSPAATWRRIAPLLSRAGITRVAEVTALDRLGVPVFQAVRPASRNISVSQGKGATRDAARVSAAMEALELWHAEDLGHLASVEMSLQEMDYANPVRSAELLWRPGARVLRGAPMSWVRARSVRGGAAAWLPRPMLELDFRLRPALEPDVFHRTSNGLAAGNCLEEALLHSLCELIERHALALARREPRRRLPVEVAAVASPHCRRMLRRVRQAGGRLAVFEIVSELGVPVVAVELALPDLPRVWGGSGCHPSPEVALSRALTEAAQSRLTYISGARDDLPEPTRAAASFQAFERFSAPRPERRLADLADASQETVAADVERVAGRLARAGHEPYFVDLTRPEIGLPVTRAFAPGLGEAHHA